MNGSTDIFERANSITDFHTITMSVCVCMPSVVLTETCGFSSDEACLRL